VGKEVQTKHLTPQGMVKECEKIIHEEEIWKEGGNPHKLIEDLGIVDSGCSRSMTRNMHRLENF
ncbi:hypothetical protein Tco_0362206, partial [Tanacetum coccineum]